MHLRKHVFKHIIQLIELRWTKILSFLFLNFELLKEAYEKTLLNFSIYDTKHFIFHSQDIVKNKSCLPNLTFFNFAINTDFLIFFKTSYMQQLRRYF